MDVIFSYLGVSFFWLGVGGCDLVLAGCGTCGWV